jgi:hypothetical protein
MIFLAAGTVAVAATKTALTLISTANIRPRVLRYDTSTDGVPTSDQSYTFQVRRFTAAGTTSAYTLQNNDPSDSAVTPLLTAVTTATVEPTYSTGFMLNRGVNPRQTHQWWAYAPDEELILPATAANGIGFQLVTAGGAAGNFLVNASVRQ